MAVIVAILVLALIGIVPALADAAPTRERVILCVKTRAEGPVKLNRAARAEPTAPRDLKDRPAPPGRRG